LAEREGVKGRVVAGFAARCPGVRLSIRQQDAGLPESRSPRQQTDVGLHRRQRRCPAVTVRTSAYPDLLPVELEVDLMLPPKG